MHDQFSFGEDVPPAFVEFVDNDARGHRRSTCREFFPTLDTHDKFTALAAFSPGAAVLVGGTKDR